MSAYSTPDEHAANPPETWRVEKKAERCWHVVDQHGVTLEYACKTKKEAEEKRLNGHSARLWRDEQRWYAGEKVGNWKPYAQLLAERAEMEAERKARGMVS
jgi:hypothetical protein